VKVSNFDYQIHEAAVVQGVFGGKLLPCFVLPELLKCGFWIELALSEKLLLLAEPFENV
jgi:hypothetical protein